ncbi:MAG: helix-turn-helix transcriptional regulator [Desulfobacteraceae bacterium]|nr:helix-turn-helix transcriptional regulator [Desulfobacteraceae bacterium]
MKTLKQYQIAKNAGITGGFLSEILAKKKNPSYKTAKKLAAVTNTDPILWLEGSSKEIRAALKLGAHIS